MTFLLAFLLVMGLPWVETNVTLTGRVGVLVRFFYVSRQCTRFCPLIRPNDMVLKSFILEKPMPFLYAACCRKPLCNSQQPVITDTEWKYGKQYGGAWDRRSGSAGLVLTLTSVSLGLRWS
ncbi:lymphocyte antigen 6K [Saccopteryx leptura]|uniref:lymphocyte antigen 6K n=1 Tax=Saccopteryx leptura TaxID=249018 RepID=UPI00339C41AF